MVYLDLYFGFCKITSSFSKADDSVYPVCNAKKRTRHDNDEIIFDDKKMMLESSKKKLSTYLTKI